MNLKKKKKKKVTWRGIQNTAETTNGGFQDFLDGTPWWISDKSEYDGTVDLYQGGNHVVTVNRDWWLCVSSKDGLKVLDPESFTEEFEVKP